MSDQVESKTGLTRRSFLKTTAAASAAAALGGSSALLAGCSGETGGEGAAGEETRYYSRCM